MTPPKAKVGDWIRFQRDAKIVVGVVSYIRKDTLGYIHYVTEIGEIREDGLLEIRSKCNWEVSVV